MYNDMMNNSWTGGMNGGSWVWVVLGTLVAVLIVVVIVKLIQK